MATGMLMSWLESYTGKKTKQLEEIIEEMEEETETKQYINVVEKINIKDVDSMMRIYEDLKNGHDLSTCLDRISNQVEIQGLMESFVNRLEDSHSRRRMYDRSPLDYLSSAYMQHNLQVPDIFLYAYTGVLSIHELNEERKNVENKVLEMKNIISLFVAREENEIKQLVSENNLLLLSYLVICNDYNSSACLRRDYDSIDLSDIIINLDEEFLNKMYSNQLMMCIDYKEIINSKVFLAKAVKNENITSIILQYRYVYDALSEDLKYEVIRKMYETRDSSYSFTDDMLNYCYSTDFRHKTLQTLLDMDDESKIKAYCISLLNFAEGHDEDLTMREIDILTTKLLEIGNYSLLDKVFKQADHYVQYLNNSEMVRRLTGNYVAYKLIGGEQ